MKKILVGLMLIVPAFFVSFDTASAQSYGLRITTDTMDDATAGQPYTYRLRATGGNSPYTWETISTTYPSACCILGMDEGTGEFTTQTSDFISTQHIGTYYWTVRVTDEDGDTDNEVVSLTINNECRINSFNSTPPSVSLGQSSTLNWSTQGCNAVQMFATNSDGNVFSSALSNSASGSYTVNSFSTTGTYYYKLAASASSTVDPVSPPVSSIVGIGVVGQSEPVPTYTAVSTYKNVIHDGTIYYVDGSVRMPYTSAGAFLSYGFNSWATVVPATASDLMLPLSNYTPTGSTTARTYFLPPRNGSLINDNGTVYLITNGTRAGFTDPTVFNRLGYSFANVLPGDTSFMTTVATIDSNTTVHPAGTVINMDGTMYLLLNSLRYGIPSMAVFNSWGLKLNEVVPANSFDREVHQGPTISARMQNQYGI